MKMRTSQQTLALTGLLLAIASLSQSSYAAEESAKKTEKAAQPVPAAAPAAQQQRQGGAGGIEKKYPLIAEGKWTGPRTPDGQPNISGHWSNTIANHNNFTDPQGGIPNDPKPGNASKTPREERALSRVTDPADGQVPFQPWALAKVKEFQVKFHDPTSPEFIEPLARCAPAGIPKSLYWHDYEIAQYPGYVLFIFGSGTRIIYLNKKEHLADNIKLWNGDSYGHWEGNTLVVDVSNHNGKALFGRSGEFISENGHITERYIFNNDNSRYNYVATFEDPTVYTRPFTVTIPTKHWTAADKPNGWHFEVELAKHAGKEPLLDRAERICTENNGGFGLGAAAPAAKPTTPAVPVTPKI